MNQTLDMDLSTLIDEIRCYLAVVETFRAMGSEPTWRPEPGARPRYDRR